MSSEYQKSVVELAVFKDFVRLAKLPIDTAIVEKRRPPEPDLLCNHEVDGKVAFELVELCDPKLAQTFADPQQEAGVAKCIRTSDPSWRIIRRKLRKSYKTQYPIELLCYTAGRIITPPDVILPTIRPLLGSFRHTFRRAWLLAEDTVYVLWN